MARHTMEPWQNDFDCRPFTIRAEAMDKDGYQEFVCNTGESEANAIRITACVNACAGLELSTIQEITARSASRHPLLDILHLLFTDREWMITEMQRISGMPNHQLGTDIDMAAELRAVIAKATAKEL